MLDLTLEAPIGVYLLNIETNEKKVTKNFMDLFNENENQNNIRELKKIPNDVLLEESNNKNLDILLPPTLTILL